MPIPILASTRDALLQLRQDTRDELLARSVLVPDPRRQRPRWFDGRFLAARDLANEQDSFLVRQADLGRAGGAGVISGLDVTPAEDPVTRAPLIQITAGEGVADTGELVILREDLSFNPANVPEIQRLDAAFGLQVIPAEPGRTRTGLYVLALRPAEWTANPIGAYPASLTGGRTVEDGDIIEGAVVSLIPYAAKGDSDWNRRRAQAARDIFLNGRSRGQLSGTLPLAMVALKGNSVVWIDPYLVRRDAGPDRLSGLDFGFGDRALRESHLLQYDEHLAAAMNAAPDRPFAAAEFFDALPPAGRLPSRTIDPETLTQRFFPLGVAAQLAFAPEDELPALLEESLLLPPLDLTLGADALAGTSVLIVVALPRSNYLRFRSILAGAAQALAPAAASPPPQRLGLASFLLRPARPPAPIPSANDAEWRAILQQALQSPTLWYVRMRNLPEPSNIAPDTVSASPAADVDLKGLALLLQKNPNLKAQIDALRSLSLPEIDVLAGRLARTPLVRDPELLSGVLAGADAARNQGSPAGVVVALAPALDPKLGDGLTLLRAAGLATGAVKPSSALPALDALARAVPAASVKALSDAVGKSAAAPLTAAALDALRTQFAPAGP